MSGQYQAGMTPPPGFERYVKPEVVPRMGFLPQDRRQHVYQLVLKFWNTAIASPRESPEFITAGQNLANLTQQLHRQSILYKQQQTQQAQAAQAAQAQGQTVPQQQQGQQQQQTQQQQQQQGQPNQQNQQSVQSSQTQQTLASQQNAGATAASDENPQAQGQAPNATGPTLASTPASGAAVTGVGRTPNNADWATFKAEIEQRIRTLLPPPEAAKTNPEEARKWMEMQSGKARQYINAYENFQGELGKLQRQVQERVKINSLTEEDKQRVRNRMNQIKTGQAQAQNYLIQFRNMALKNQKDTASAGGNSQGDVQAQTQPTTQSVQPAAPAAIQPQIKNEPGETSTPTAPSQPQTQSQLPSQAQTQGIIQSQQAANNTPQTPITAPSPATQTPAPAQQPVPAGVPVKTEPQRAVPPQGQANQPTQPGLQPQALSHQAAIDRARSHPQTAGHATGTPTSAQAPPHHGHPGMPRPESSQSRSDINRHNISKQLNVTPLQPVSMPSARPTLSGGPGAAPGVMSQPGLQKHPGFVLEGEGERVLSEKKLEELVRQVTGGGGGEGADVLDPEVKETLLDLADEFVDNVIMSACRVAKLRSSSTLELRDLQLILERNYNIRVPGYASDELRTVKKIQPSQAWAQKMSAVQAAKVTGGKNDL